MRSAQRIADQHDVSGRPVAIRQQRKIPPYGLVRHQHLAVQIVSEELLAVTPGLFVASLVQPRPVPGGGIALDQEGAHRGAVPVVMRHPCAVLVGTERERKAVEGLARAVPGELVGQPLHLGLEPLRVRGAHQRIDPVGADYKVRPLPRSGRFDPPGEVQNHARGLAECLQHPIEFEPRDRGKTVSVDVHDAVAVDDALHRPGLHP